MKIKCEFLFDDIKTRIVIHPCDPDMKVLINGILDFLNVNEIKAKVRWFDKFGGGWSEYQDFNLKHYDAKTFNKFYLINDECNQNYLDGFSTYIASPPIQIYNENKILGDW